MEQPLCHDCSHRVQDEVEAAIREAQQECFAYAAAIKRLAEEDLQPLSDQVIPLGHPTVLCSISAKSNRLHACLTSCNQKMLTRGVIGLQLLRTAMAALALVRACYPFHVLLYTVWLSKYFTIPMRQPVREMPLWFASDMFLYLSQVLILVYQAVE